MILKVIIMIRQNVSLLNNIARVIGLIGWNGDTSHDCW